MNMPGSGILDLVIDNARKAARKVLGHDLLPLCEKSEQPESRIPGPREKDNAAPTAPDASPEYHAAICAVCGGCKDCHLPGNVCISYDEQQEEVQP